MNLVLCLILLSFLSACSHTINFRASHFAVPITGEDSWSGHVAGVGAGATKITVVNDIESNPPNRTYLGINEDFDVADLFLFNNIGIDASLTLIKGLDLYLDSSLIGARYQFLNHGSSSRVWVGSLQGAMGGKKTSSGADSSGNSSSVAEAVSDVTTSQAGISLGYKFEKVVPYFSYIHEFHSVKTSVTNSGGAFGPYEDQGNHDYYSVGLSSHGRGLRYALEYNYIEIKWDRSSRKTQETAGFKLGYAW